MTDDHDESAGMFGLPQAEKERILRALDKPKSPALHPTPPQRADGTPWAFRTAAVRAQLAPEPQPLRRPIRAQRRFRAVLWDPICCSAVFLGSFETQEERDAAVNEGKARRALGLFVRP